MIRPVYNRSLAMGALVSLGAVACGANLTPLRPTMTPAPVGLCAAECSDSIAMTYFGTGGFLIRHGDDALLTSPAFTHHSALSVFFELPISSDTTLVRWMMGRERLDGVHAILVGHSHYDHLMDAPFVAKALVPDAGLYGGPTMRFSLWPDTALRPRLHALDGDAVGSRTKAGVWIQPEGSRFRFMALHSSHAPTFYRFFGHWPYTFASGKYTAPLDALPNRPGQWRLGEPYAYLIDLLDAGNRPVFRIFYEDAAAEPEYSVLPPLPPEDQHRVNVAIICAGNFGNASNYPTVLLDSLTPDYVIVGHWENFFRQPVPPFGAIPFNSSRVLAKRIDPKGDRKWVTPEPLAHLIVRF